MGYGGKAEEERNLDIFQKTFKEEIFFFFFFIRFLYKRFSSLKKSKNMSVIVWNPPATATALPSPSCSIKYTLISGKIATSECAENQPPVTKN